MSIQSYYKTCYKLIPNEVLNDRLIPIKVFTESPIQGYRGRGTDLIVRVANKDTIETRFKFYCNDFTLNIGDLIKYDNKTYEVVSEPRNTANRNHHIKTMIRKVDNIKQK